MEKSCIEARERADLSRRECVVSRLGQREPGSHEKYQSVRYARTIKPWHAALNRCDQQVQSLVRLLLVDGRRALPQLLTVWSRSLTSSRWTCALCQSVLSMTESPSPLFLSPCCVDCIIYSSVVNVIYSHSALNQLMLCI